jgi:pimeloyl-ACP methyl ester carboxylesterase
MITLRAGRRVAVYRLADGDRTVVLCHAAPGSGAFDPDPDETSRYGVTLIAVDRPGYGASDRVKPDEWATVASAADDVAEVLDQLGVGPVGVAGWSGGGRVALALAARRPELVERIVVIATPAPNEEVQWVPPEIQAGVDALRGQPAEQAHAAMGAQLQALVPADPRSIEALGPVGHSEADDTTALTVDGARERLGEMLAAAYAQGGVGMTADVAGYTLQPWGFDPADVKAETLLLYGARDPMGGSAHGGWWRQHLPNARLEIDPDAGHMLIIQRWGRALSHLAPAGDQ